MQAIASPLHPLNDSRLKERHTWYTERPANDPDFLFRLAEKMQDNARVREMVYHKFRTGDLEWLMHSGQKIIYDTVVGKTEEDEFLILCSRQLGKSFVSLLLAIMHCSTQYGRKRPLVRIFCETEKQVKEIVEDNMSIIMLISPPDFIRHTKSERRFMVGKGEIRIALLAGARVDGKRGGNATLVITEEGAFSPSETFKYAVDSIISPQLLRSGGRLIHITTSSTDEIHHIHSVIQPKCEAKGTLVNLTIYHNPQLTDIQIIKAFEKIFDGTTESWQREYLCQVIRSMMLTVIPEFNEKVVGKNSIPPYAFWQTTIDFGGTRDKHGIIIGYHDFLRKKDVICGEALLDVNTGTNVIKATAFELEQVLKSDQYHINSHDRYIDAPGQVRVDLMGQHDFACGAVQKGDGSFEAGIIDMRMGFVSDTLEIWPECTNLINCLKYGKLNKQRTDFERHPMFGHLDILAALMYFLRHINRTNPYPLNYGLSSKSNYINGKDRLSEGQQNIVKGLFG